ncbi:MAG: class I SAM-dependent methyltransferase [Planctomycetes bacterium]|nr:class I SAM-dependent methyltransferase [Planctomycetota bacterium]
MGDSKETRFAFGQNWADFLKGISEERILDAENSLKSMLAREELKGLQILDIGSGSGLFSLAAHRLGAQITSFDYDKDSVACTQKIKEQFAPDSNWQIEEGSVLDQAYLEKFQQFDVVYSWGVLHHTGSMWQAIMNAADKVKPRGQFFIAIYNKHWTSIIWKGIKWFYNTSPSFVKSTMNQVFTLIIFLWLLVSTGRNPLKLERGMDFKHDVIDWIGGYPYEYASIDELDQFLAKRGFKRTNLKKPYGWTGCNELVYTLVPQK